MPITAHMPVPRSTIEGPTRTGGLPLLAGGAHDAAEGLHQRVVAGPRP